MKEIKLRMFFDAHCHLRTERILSNMIPFIAVYASKVIVMPNTRPRAILTGDDVIWYRNEIQKALRGNKMPFEPLMTIEIRDNTTPQTVEEAKKAGVVAGKAYPLGVTTNSDEGLRDFFSGEITDTFQAMEDIGMLLLIHGELDGEKILVTEREKNFIPVLVKLSERFPKLKIVFEHVSTKFGVYMVEQLGENVAATITVHHLCLTLNDVIGYGIKPHNACMPIPKTFEDRDALIEAATSGNPKFFLGSDSAPHFRNKKECFVGACGIFSAPVVPALLAEIFEKEGRFNRLEAFTSANAAKFYGQPLSEEKITLVKKDWVVIEEIDGIVPFMARQKLYWEQVL
ncbi:dihydroorotase [Candidatus Wolfebacteria bacterium]|nr:dihydroorotase [Candidatus Wolfebacteria bacterium]